MAAPRRGRYDGTGSRRRGAALLAGGVPPLELTIAPERHGGLSGLILCPACGCACDDLAVATLATACPRGAAWFAQWPDDPDVALLAGKPATTAAALAAAARLLSAARAPAVVGGAGLALDAQRAAVALAERVRGLVVPLLGPWAAVRRAMQDVGLVTATLGEIRHRAELVVFWDCQPAATHPRWLERFVPATGALLERPRELVFVGAATPWSPEVGHVSLPSGGTIEALVELRRAAKSAMVAEPWQTLAARLTSARCSAIVFGETLAVGGRWACRALFELTRDLNNGAGRCVAVPLGPGNNAGGMESVLAWQTGWATAVDFGGDGPRPAWPPFAADVLVMAGDAPAPAGFDGVPCIRIGPRLDSAAAVSLRTRVPGVTGGGVWFRDDDVPLPLRPFRHDRAPEAAALFEALAAELP